MNTNYDFGKCPRCGGELKPIYFQEEETKVEFGIMTRTGRKRTAISHLTCKNCERNVCIDDSFSGPWHF